MASKSSLSKLEIKLIYAGKMLLHLPSANDEIVSALKVRVLHLNLLIFCLFRVFVTDYA